METGTKRLQRRANHTVKRLTLDTILANSRKAPVKGSEMTIGAFLA